MSDGKIRRGPRKAGDIRAPMVSITVKLDEESAVMLEALKGELGTGHLVGETSFVIRKAIAFTYSEWVRRDKTIS